MQVLNSDGGDTGVKGAWHGDVRVPGCRSTCSTAGWECSLWQDALMLYHCGAAAVMSCRAGAMLSTV